MVRRKFIWKAPEVNHSFDGSPGIQPSVLREVDVLGRVLIATQRELDKKWSAGKLCTVGYINAKVVFDIWFRECFVRSSAVRANIDCVSCK